MPLNESRDIFGIGWFGDPVGHINGVEITSVQKSIHRFEIDVIRVHMIRLLPTSLAYGAVSGGADTSGLGANDVMFAIRFVPHGNYGDPVLRGHDARSQLSGRLMRKPVSYAKRILAEDN
jgi:hypothetical protein